MEADDGEGSTVECVVSIDHMNDRAGYVKQLQRWAAQLALGTRLLHGGTPRRPRRVLCVLCGPHESVREFLQRLRTHTVDVDRGGRPCRERQATVEWQRPVAAGARERLSGWASEDVDDERALRAALATLGLRDSDVVQLFDNSEAVPPEPQHQQRQKVDRKPRKGAH